MAERVWEPVGQSRKWEPVGRQDIEQGLGNLGQNILGSAEAVITAPLRFLATGPSVIGHGIAGALTGQPIDEALSEGVSRPFTEGFITPKGQEAMEALGHYAYEVPREFIGDVASKAATPGMIGARVEPGASDALARGIGETGFDVLSTVLGGAAMRGKGKPKLSPEAEAYLRELQARKEQEQAVRPGPTGEQLELPGMERPTVETPEQTAARLSGMEEIKSGPQGEQLRLWEPVGEESKRPIVPDEVNEAMLADLGIKTPEKEPSFPNIRGEGTIDFPFRQEALERDPKIYDMRQQYRSALTKGDYERAARVLMDAEIYVENQFNIRATLGPMFGSNEGTGTPMALPIQRGAPREPGMTGPAVPYEKVPVTSGIIQRVKNFRNQGGVIDPDLLTFGVADLLQRDGWEATMKRFRGTFAKQSLDQAIKDSMDPKSRETLILMTPDQFLDFAQDRNKLGLVSEIYSPFERQERELVSNEKRESIRKGLKSEGGLNSLPQLLLSRLKEESRYDSVIAHNGRHRADVFKEQGLDLMPVRVKHANLRWGEVDPSQYPTKVFTQNGDLRDFPQPSSWTHKGTPPQSERGSIGFPRDPQFEAFKDSLPEALKGEAKQMYEEFKKTQEKKPEVVQNERALTAIKKVPGMEEIFSEVAPIEKSLEELKPQILTESDLGGGKMAQLGRAMVSGGKLLGFGSQNTVVRYGVQLIDNALRRAEKFMRAEIQHKDTGLKPIWEKLSSKEQDSLWPVMIAAEGKEVFSKPQLQQMGMSDKQIGAYNRYREVMDKVLERINAARQLVGKKPIPPRQAYVMSRFLGDFKVDVTDASGKRVHSIGAATSYGAEKARKMLQAKYPDLTFSEVRHEPTHRIGSTDDVTKGYQALLHMLDEEDPRVAALESTIQEYNNAKGFDVLGYKRHFIPKSETPVKGFEGSKEWQSQRQNTKEGLHATMLYVDQAMRWAELQEANQILKKMWADKEIMAAQPNSTKFVKGYFDQIAGRSNGLAKAIDVISDVVAEKTGIGHSLQIRSVREAKQFFTSLYLGFWNLGFSISQIMQPIQMLPAWFHYLHKRGGGKNSPAAIAGGMRDAVWYNANPEKMSPFGQAAMKHADEFGITDAHILEDVRSVNESKTHKVWTALSTYNMTAPERVARRMTYLMFSHYLKESGMKQGKRLFETAANLTDMSMVDYRLHERANIYKQLGIVGESASALTTFKHNYYTQMWALGKRGGSPVLANFMLMNALFGGLMGFYGREEIDALMGLLNKIPGVGRIPSMTETVLKFPDLVAFGGLSAATGLDLSPKFSMSNLFPDELGKALFPFGQTIANVAEQGAGLITHPSKSQAMRLANEAVPGPGKVLTEKYFREGDRTLHPKSLEGKYDRSPFEWMARGLSLRSTKESRETQQNYQKKLADQFYIDKRSAISKETKDAYFEGKLTQPEWKRLSRKYVANEGNVMELVEHLVRNVKSQKQAEARRELMEALQNPVRYKRLEAMGGH